MTATVDTLAVVLAVGLGIVAGLLVAFVIQGLLRFVVRRHPATRTPTRAISRPLQAIAALVGAWIGLRIGWGVASDQSEPWLRSMLQHGLLVAVILSATWFVAALIDGTEHTVLERLRAGGQSRYRKVQTQLQILHRIVIVVVWVLGIAMVLMTFPSARGLGATLFTSAGLLSVVIGIAAQSTLGNVFAGLQLAFSDSIRMGDIVVWQKEFTTVEEITLTYVVLKVWDGRRLIVPSSQMTTSTFENWTRRTPDLLGYVDFELDWSAPIPQMRSELQRILERTDLWDGDTGILQVRDATASRLQVSILLSAENASMLTDLKYYVRESMVRWIQDNAPHAIPHNRSLSEDEVTLAGLIKPGEGKAEGLEAGEGDSEGAESGEAGAAESSQPGEVETAAEAARKDQPGQQNRPDQQNRPGRPGQSAHPTMPEGHGRQYASGKPSEPAEPTAADLAATAVMSAEDIEAEMPVRVSVRQRGLDAANDVDNSAGHESAIFTGSQKAEKRAQEFAGPGEEALKEREHSLERQKEAERLAQGENGHENSPSATKGAKIGRSGPATEKIGPASS